MWITVLLILLYFREEILQENELVFGHKHFKFMLLLSLLLALVVGDGLFELLRRWKQCRRVTGPHLREAS